MLFYFFLGSCCKLWKEKGEKKRKKADIPFLPPQAYLPLYRKSSPEWAKKPPQKMRKQTWASPQITFLLNWISLKWGFWDQLVHHTSNCSVWLIWFASSCNVNYSEKNKHKLQLNLLTILKIGAPVLLLIKHSIQNQTQFNTNKTNRGNRIDSQSECVILNISFV